MIGVEINTAQIARLETAVRNAGKSISKEISGALNQVSKKTKLNMGKGIRDVVAMNKSDSEQSLKISAGATPQNLQVTVSLKKTRRLGLRHFGARQDAKGVSYKIGKGGGRKRVNGAFQGPKPGVIKLSWRGNVFKRSGKARLPIYQLRGVSPFGAYVKNDLEQVDVKAVNDELTKQLERRIKLNVLRANGLVST